MRLTLILVVVLVAGCGGATATPTPEPQTLNGTVTLQQASRVVRSPSVGCHGTSGYEDVRDGMPVIVRDEAGVIVAATELVSLPEPEALAHCTYTFEVLVPGAAFYEITVGKRGDIAYSRDQLAARGWTVQLTLGE